MSSRHNWGWQVHREPPHMSVPHAQYGWVDG